MTENENLKLLCSINFSFLVAFGKILANSLPLLLLNAIFGKVISERLLTRETVFLKSQDIF